MKRPPVRMSECRACAAPIVWCLLDTGKRIPLNPLPDEKRGNVACHIAGGNLHGFVISRDHRPGPLDPLRMVPHHATCEEHQRTTKSTPAEPDPALF